MYHNESLESEDNPFVLQDRFIGADECRNASGDCLACTANLCPADPEGYAIMTQVTMYTDGACSGNPGPAGWAAILVAGNHEKEVVGGAVESTNNRAELMAVVTGFQALKFACEVRVVTDSQYMVGVLSLGWKRKANHDLLAQADALMAKHTVSFTKVQGHSGNAMNERCDQLAKAEVERQRSKVNYSAERACFKEVS